VQSIDLGAEGFAALFARRYLSWNASDPQAYQNGLAQFVAVNGDPDDGLTLPASGSQQVLWDAVVQVRSDGPGTYVFTVVVQTDASGLLYLSVPVVRLAGGPVALAGYPAFVGAPASAPLRDGWASLPAVADPALLQVARRALGNYLAGAESNLAADLADDARVSLPALPLALRSVRDVTWSADRRSVLAVVTATDARDAEYTLAYELDVARTGGRWEISAIQMDPDT
jgi:hypothetical protein